MEEPTTELKTTEYFGKSQLDGGTRLIEIDYERNANFSDIGIEVIESKQLLEGETLQEGLARACCALSDNSEHAQRLYDYASKLWFKFPTPVLANSGTEKGLPINCYLSQVGDDMGSIAEHYAENMFLAVRGGGIGTDMSLLRSIGTKTSKGNHTPGVIPFIRVIDSQVLASIQGSTRRGAAAVYLHISHPEIEEFIEVRKPTGDKNRRSHNIHNAVTIPDAFMEAVENGDEWPLIDPHTKEITKLIDARDLWMKILATRVSTGEPYLFFEDTANAALPQHLKDKDLRINLTNLCTEIMLPTSPDRTAVCCLSSVNLEFFDEWSKEEMFIEDLLRMLDNVLSIFVNRADPHMHRAIESAKNERSVGLGAMGFHTFLQRKGVPWESAMASAWNVKIFKHLKKECDTVNLKLGAEKGEAPDAEGTGLRFSHTQAIAPNGKCTLTHNSVSPSVEPYAANAFSHVTDAGSFTIKNRVLEELLKSKYKLTDAEIDKVWKSIILNEGSVQHIDALPNGESFDAKDKEIFKTAMELDQTWIIDHAAVRQNYIDQGQSINLFIEPTISKAELHKIHKRAWSKGLKALYYCRSKSVARTEKLSEDESINWAEKNTECMSCEG